MRIAKLFLTASMLVGTGLAAAEVEMTRPFEALEQSRRAMMELDQRLRSEKARTRKLEKEQENKRKREAAEIQKRERQESAEQEAQRKRDAATRKAVQGAGTVSTSLLPQPSAASTPAEKHRAQDTPAPATRQATERQPVVQSTPAEDSGAQAMSGAPTPIGRATDAPPGVQNAPPVRTQVGAHLPTAAPAAPTATGTSRPNDPEPHVGVTRDPGEPKGVPSGAMPLAGSVTAPINPAATAPTDGRYAVTVGRLQRMNLYNERGEKLGDVERVLQARDGKFHIVIGAGGFLGLRERDVIIPLEKVTLRGERLTAEGLTDDQVRIMPVFDRKDSTFRDLARGITVHIIGDQSGK